MRFLFSSLPFNLNDRDLNFYITQKFGEHPEVYQKYGLRYHEGVDFGLPVGTELFAVADGVVLNATCGAYGECVKIKLANGSEVVYAHLSEILVSPGDHVSAGQVIAKSGNTGRTTGPHLHFGFRWSNAKQTDGLFGYSDPLPHLLAVKKYVGSPFGFHLMTGVNGRMFLDELQRVRPSLLVLLDPNIDYVQLLRQVLPDTVLVGRVNLGADSYVEERILRDPVEAARWMHKKSLDNAAVSAGLLDFVLAPNEVAQTWDKLPSLAACELERMKLADQQGLFKAAIFAFSVGQIDLPKHDRMAAWRLLDSALVYAEAMGHVVAVHEYGAPDLWGPDFKGGADWLLHRLEHQVLWRLPYRKLKFIVSEYGVDGGLLEPPPPKSQAGWRGRRTYNNDVRRLLTDLTDIFNYVEQWRNQVLGYAFYCLGEQMPWESFDANPELLSAVADFYDHEFDLFLKNVDSPTDEESEDVEESNMNYPEVYDQSGVKRSWDWLTDNFGPLKYFPADCAVGDEYWKLVRVEVTEGPALIKFRTLRGNNVPAEGQVCVYFWAGGSVLPVNACATVYKRNVSHGRTDAMGYVGFGLGHGSYYYNNEERPVGPHACWVCSSAPSDVIDGVGMLAGTNHVGPLSLVFQLVVKEPEAKTFDDLLWYLGDKAQTIFLNPEAALQHQIFADGAVPVCNEFDFMWDGVKYIAQKAEFLDHQEERMYYVQFGVWDDVKYVVKDV